MVGRAQPNFQIIVNIPFPPKQIFVLKCCAFFARLFFSTLLMSYIRHEPQNGTARNGMVLLWKKYLEVARMKNKI